MNETIPLDTIPMPPRELIAKMIYWQLHHVTKHHPDELHIHELEQWLYEGGYITTDAEGSYELTAAGWKLYEATMPYNYWASPTKE